MYLLGVVTVLVVIPVLALAAFGAYALANHPAELQRVRAAERAKCEPSDWRDAPEPKANWRDRAVPTP
jgi:hypothetical protein